MARNLENIRPASARQLATEAVGSEVALVSRLVGYNDLLKQLFEILQSKFQTGESPSGKVSDLLQQINSEAGAINELDKHFNTSLSEFDKLTS